MILFHCQHLLGLGHLQRAARLVRALRAAGEPVVLVQGGRPVPELDVGGAEVVQLPPLRALDPAASALARPDGTPPDAAYLADRRDRLLALLAARDPAVVLLELFPFGRHALAAELGPLLLAVAADRRRRGPAAPRVAVSLRDVLVSRANQPWFELTALAIVRAWIDVVLVHGSPDVIPLDRTFALARELGDRLVYTGYLGPDGPPAPADGPREEVIVSGGGGEVAGPLFRAALAARPLSRAAGGRRWRLVTGPYLPPAERAAVEARAAAEPPLGAGPAVLVEAFRPDLPALLARAALSVSQAGYNTVLDVVASGARAVLVPYEGSGDEQPLRARLLAERGLVEVVPAAALAPASLAAAMDRALARPGFPAPAGLDLAGAGRSVACLQALAGAVRRARAARAPAAQPGRCS
jgi:predicted glycosyltransferase